MPTTFERELHLPVSTDTAYEWHARPGALDRLLPPWDKVDIIRRSNGISPGTQAEMQVSTPIGKKRWVAEHLAAELPEDAQQGIRQFVDIALQSPFKSWRHEHTFLPTATDHTILRDRIQFEMPMEAFGGGLAKGMVLGMLNQMFAFRHAVTLNDITRHHQYDTNQPKRILVVGGTGLVGQTLCPFLTTGGHTVVTLTRKKTNDDGSEIEWSPNEGKLDASDLEGFDAVIQLAGANLADKRWTPEFKKLIRDSRVVGTRLLAERLTEVTEKPQVLISASATGFYGDRGDQELHEESPAGEGFLSDVSREWEAAAEPAREAGIRVVHPRIGVVLTPQGGALEKFISPFKFGAGGPMGSGKQFWSWIAIDDLVYGLFEVMMNESYSGPVNLVSPNPSRVNEFTKTLGRVMGRPSMIPAPAFALRLALGEMADALLLASTKVIPSTLQSNGFQFAFPTLEEAFRHLLGKRKSLA